MPSPTTTAIGVKPSQSSCQWSQRLMNTADLRSVALFLTPRVTADE